MSEAPPPGAEGSRNHAEDPNGQQGSPSTRRPRILVADDDTHVRDLAELVLGNSGFAVTCARDGEEAWRLLTADYDLLLTDRDMPGMNGPQLIARARHKWPGLAIVLMSGTAPAPGESLPEGSKPDAFLPKPFTVAALLAIVNGMTATS